MDYEVIIVGAGPAGIFAALTLADAGVEAVLLIELGKDISRRCREDMLCGWGGAGAYSDGKLTLSPEVGGFLGEFLDREALFQLLKRADAIWVGHGAPERVFGDASAKLEELSDRARMADLVLIPSRIRHIGTENCHVVLEALRRSLEGRIEIRTGCQVERILTENGGIRGVQLSEVRRLQPVRGGGAGAIRGCLDEARSRIAGIANRRQPGGHWGACGAAGPVLQELTDAIYESKLIYYSKTFDDKVRTFCMNPYGEVVTRRPPSL